MPKPRRLDVITEDGEWDDEFDNRFENAMKSMNFQDGRPSRKSSSTPKTGLVEKRMDFGKICPKCQQE